MWSITWNSYVLQNMLLLSWDLSPGNKYIEMNHKFTNSSWLTFHPKTTDPSLLPFPYNPWGPRQTSCCPTFSGPQIPWEKSETTELHGTIERIDNNANHETIIAILNLPGMFLKPSASNFQLGAPNHLLVVHVCIQHQPLQLAFFWRSWRLGKWDYYATDSCNVATKVNVPGNWIGWPWCWDSPT